MTDVSKGEDAVEVYEPINIAPFDHRGRLEFPQ